MRQCERYLARMPLAAGRRRDLLQRVANRGATPLPEAMSELHAELAGHPCDADRCTYDSVRRRLSLAYGLPQTGAGPVIADHPGIVEGQGRLELHVLAGRDRLRELVELGGVEHAAQSYGS